jgi:hypothetical protein
MNRILNKLLIGIVCLLLTQIACKAKKQAVAPPPVVKKDTTAITAYDLLKSTIKPWTYFSSKINADYTDGNKNISVSITLRMYKDSLVWVSAGMFGIEGFRALINKDSVVILNKLEKNYAIIKTKEFSGITSTPLTVEQIQNIVIAKPVFDLQQYQIKTNTIERLSIMSDQIKLGLLHHYKPSTLTMDSAYLSDKKNPGNWARIAYSEYIQILEHAFPLKAIIETHSIEQKSNSVQLNYTDVDFISPITFPLTIPSSYAKAK